MAVSAASRRPPDSCCHSKKDNDPDRHYRVEVVVVVAVVAAAVDDDVDEGKERPELGVDNHIASIYRIWIPTHTHIYIPSSTFNCIYEPMMSN